MLFCFCFGSLLFAQTDNDVVDFSDISYKNDDFGKDLLLFKTNPFSFVDGTSFIEIEKVNNNTISLQAGIGIVLGDSYVSIESLIRNDGLKLPNNSRQGKLGAYFSGSVKLYFSEEAPDGAYVSLVTTFAKRNVKLNKYGNINNGEFEKESVNNTMVALRFGHQDVLKKVLLDFFVGLGANFQNGVIQEKVVVGSNTLYPLNMIHRKILHIELGFRIGIPYHYKK